MARKLMIRADADERLGTGHLMRCLALAQAWQAAGGQTIFVSRCPAAKLRGRIRAAGAELIPLEAAHPDPSDLATVLSLAAEHRPSNGSPGGTWVVLDGYHFDAAYQQALRDASVRLMVVDDLACGACCHADLVLNQNLGAEQLCYPCAPETVLLLGTRYALLRPEFKGWQSWRRQYPDVARRLLVTAGGADPGGVTRTMLRAIELLDLPGLETKVVIGPASPQRVAGAERRVAGAERSDAPAAAQAGASLRSATSHPATSHPATSQLSDVSNMAELMVWADLALSAAGSTCWELAFVQLPAIVLTLAENQQMVAQRLAEAGAVTSLGRADRLAAEDIARALADLCRNRDQRVSQGEAGRRLVDGRGAERVVAVMNALDGDLTARCVRLRPASADDALPLWRLANDPAARGWSLSPAAIPLEDHVAWFHRKLADPGARIWVLDLHGLLVGVIRYERTEPDTAEVSCQVAAPFRRRGLATRLLQETRQRAREELGVDHLRAIVRRENAASARTFAKVGFACVDSRLIQNQPCHVFESPIRDPRPLIPDP